jgi:hypothetical protein
MSYADNTDNDVAIRPVSRLLSGLLDRLRPTVYIDGRDVPDPPESPYRARLTLPLEQRSDDVDLREREIVRGEMKTIYEVRCSCGKRWFNRRFENVQLCPRCGCAVLLNPLATAMP